MTIRAASRLAAAAQNLKKAEGPKKVYVGSLHYNINEDMLKAIFSPFGQIDRITVMRDTDTNISRGYAFVDVSYGTFFHRTLSFKSFKIGRPSLDPEALY